MDLTFKQLKMGVSDEEISMIFQAMDKKHTGEIMIEDFMKMIE